jgi:hypothetical protein
VGGLVAVLCGVALREGERALCGHASNGVADEQCGVRADSGTWRAGIQQQIPRPTHGGQAHAPLRGGSE